MQDLNNKINQIKQEYKEVRFKAQNTNKLVNIMVLVMYFATLPIKLLKGFLAKHKPLPPTILQPSTHNLLGIDVNYIIDMVPKWRTNLFNSVVSKSVDNDGKNHDTYNQTADHASYLFGLSLLSKDYISDNDDAGLFRSIHVSGHLSRGYGYDENGAFKFNTKSTDLKNLAALNLYMTKTTNEALLDKYDQLVQNIINHDYALLEAETPDNPYAAKVWEDSKQGMKFKVKSWLASMGPNSITRPVDALVLLATLTTNYNRNRNPDCLESYKELSRTFGYKLLASSVDYDLEYADEIAMSLYALVENTTDDKEYWQKVMYRVWKSQKHTFNHFFTGLMFLSCPEYIYEENNREYIEISNHNLNRHWDAILTPSSNYKNRAIMMALLYHIDTIESKAKLESEEAVEQV